MIWSIAYTARGMAPDSLPEPIAVASLVTGALTRIGVSYVIGGSFASSVHGEPRSTNDIDMVVDLRQGDMDAFINAIASECYVSRDAVAETGLGNVYLEQLYTFGDLDRDPRERTVTSGLSCRSRGRSKRASRQLNVRTLYGQLFEQYRVPTQRL